MSAYYLLWKKALKEPTLPRMMIAGTTSGVVGIAVWKLLFAQHKNPPQNYRYGYYRQLLTAHIVFTIAAMLTYKSLGRRNED